MSGQIIGRGRLYFERFAAGTQTPTGGEQYFGNTPELSLNQSAETVEHYSSEGGLKELDASVDLSVDSGGSFGCDDISLPNLALWYAGETDTQTVAGAANQTYAINDVERGRYYQIGESDAQPDGLRDITLDNVTEGAATVTGSAYEFDGDLGRLYVLDGADTQIGTGDDIVVHYDQTATSADIVVSGNTSLFGRLRFISDNPVGRNRDYFWPYVKLSSDGDFPLKGDDWQQMGFTFKALKLANRQRVYIRDRASTN